MSFSQVERAEALQQRGNVPKIAWMALAIACLIAAVSVFRAERQDREAAPVGCAGCGAK